MRKIKKETIEQVDGVLLEVISSYVELKKSGSLYKGLSPFNSERSPSFIVSPSKGIWKDFSSGKGGKSAIKFVKEYEGLSFRDAVVKCADILGVEVEYEDSDEVLLFDNAIESIKKLFKENLKDEAKSYVCSRGINNESIKEWEIGYAPSFNEMVAYFNNSLYKEEFLSMKYFYKADGGKIIPKFYDRVMFPINNQYGNTVGFSGRDIKGNKKAKYINSNDFEFFKKGKILYGLDKVKKNSKKIIVVEGQIDVILAHQYGIKITVASQGTGFTQFHFNLLKDYSVLFAFDGDKPGKKAMVKSSEIFLRNGIDPKVCVLPKGNDIADVLTKHGQKEFLKIIKYNSYATDFSVDYLMSNTKEEKIFEAINMIKDNLSLFPIHISEKILNKLLSVSKQIEINNKNIKKSYIDEMMIVKYIIENSMEEEFIKPFKECFNLRNFQYNYVKEVSDLDEESFYSLWGEFEASCYKKRIKKIKESDLPYKDKKEQIKELKEFINVSRFI